jgi:hypothetical protein
MSSLVRKLLSHGPFPEDLPIPAINGNDHELVAVRYGNFVMRARSAAVPGFRSFTVRHGRGDEDAITPDDWRRMPLARQRDSPADVLALAPFYWWSGVGRDASTQWATPLGPVKLSTVAIFGLACHRHCHRDSSQEDQQAPDHAFSSNW